MLNLVIHSLKSKKNWFILNLVITAIITIIMPTLFRDNYGFFSILTMFMTSGLILVSNFRELAFLHDDRKISYYLSKPISIMNKINIALISNAVFTTVVFLLTFAIASLSGAIFTAIDPRNSLEAFNYMAFVDNNLEFAKIMYAWIMMIGFIITLSSVLTGNDTVSVFVTIFNYALPTIFLLVITFICNILDNTIIGMSTDAMIQAVIDKFLPIEKIYYFDYINKAIDIIYFLRLLLYFAISYILTIFAVKTRKNERTGDFIVHNGYKYFISIFASLLLPMFVTSNMGRYSLFTVVAVLVLLSALSYYILISILDRSFRMSRQSLLIYIPFIIIFVASIFISSAALSSRASFIPVTSDVKAVYIGSGTNYLKNTEYQEIYYNQWESIIKASYDDVKDNENIILLEEKDNVEKVKNLHQTLMDNKQVDNYGYRELTIVYFLNNGKKIVRSYKIPYDYADMDNIDEVVDIARAEEFIQDRFRLFIDENFVDNVKFSNIYSYSDGLQHDFNDLDFKRFTQLYMEDYRSFINNDKNKELLHINIIVDINNFDYVKNSLDEDFIEKGPKNEEIYTLFFEPLMELTMKNLSYVPIPKQFVKTIEYLDSLK